MLRPTLIVAALALSGCVTAGDFTPTQAPATVAEAVLDIRYQLRNPEAATFRNVRAFSIGTAGGVVVCGDVNGENGYGGLSGFTPFRASVDPSGRVRALYVDDIPARVAPCV